MGMFADKGEVYTWGWKECVPSVKLTCSWATVKNSEDETVTRQSSTLIDQGILEIIVFTDIKMSFTIDV